MRVLVLRDPKGYIARNVACLDRGGRVGTIHTIDGSVRGYREVDGERIWSDEEWIEVDEDQVDAHYASVGG